MPENASYVCDECDGTGIEVETTDAGHEIAIDCHLCEGAGFFDSDGYPLGEDD